MLQPLLQAAGVATSSVVMVGVAGRWCGKDVVVLHVDAASVLLRRPLGHCDGSPVASTVRRRPRCFDARRLRRMLRRTAEVLP